MNTPSPNTLYYGDNLPILRTYFPAASAPATPNIQFPPADAPPTPPESSAAPGSSRSAGG